MLSIEVIDIERINFGYISHQFKIYNRHCNKMKRFYKETDRSLYLAYSLEANMAKFKMLNSRAYLYKNLRLLKKFTDKNQEDSQNSTYQEYVECFIKKGSEIDKIVDLRNKLADFYSFLADIYVLNDNRHDFEPYKTKYIWHDISLVFETKKILDSFLDGTFCMCDFRFNTQLALKILAVEEKIKKLKSVVRERKEVIQVFECSKELSTAVCTLERFLSDNFVESNFITVLKVSTDQIFSYIKSILDYQNGDLTARSTLLTIPELFKDIQVELQDMEKSKKVDSQKLRAILVETVEKRLKVDDRPRKMPFLPVFYDLAYDFIEYPEIDDSAVGIAGVAGMFKKFEFFNKK